ncbi:hypothetical protein NDN08_000442 [Rhodosorus marinus]|uniref:PNK FHA domain-containing protein n=1 Tax=Rhodosorus marinus TaxID=101924 RepID=A0AAV8UTJ5_9RHOD|nr:hypothetical protein NDN08_000442 [Rhodosorus marinus]
MMKRKYQTTMESFIKTAANSDEGLEEYNLKWSRDDDVLWAATKNFSLKEEEKELKVAAYDLDGTIIGTKSGKAVGKHAHDWRLYAHLVPEKLVKETDRGFVICIFTNQAGIKSNYTPEGMIRVKFQQVIRKLAVPCAIFVSCTYGYSRKPSTGMWKTFLRSVSNGKSIASSSFFVGDAAGRQKDFSDSDRKFARNCNLDFYTPEEYFYGDQDNSVRDLPLKGIDFKAMLVKEPTSLLDPPNALDSLKAGEQQMIILIGYPGAGKSTFSEAHLTPLGVVRINMDTLGTKAKCFSLAQTSLAEGRSVVIDNTNPRPDSRGPFIDIAKARNIPARAFHFQASKDFAMHMSAVRRNQGGRMIPPQAYALYNNGFRKPQLEEGFLDIVSVGFVPVFKDEAHKQAFLECT